MARFRYCLNASTIRTTPVLRQIEAAAKAGFEAIELWHDHIDEHLQSGGSLADIQTALDDYGLDVPTTIYLAGWFQPEGEAHQRAIDEIRRRLEQSAAVGAAFAIAGPPPDKADRDLGGRHYHELLEIGKEFGVRPAFEYLGFVDDINTIDDAIDIITRSGHPDATIVVDPFHCRRGGGPFESLAKLRSEQIAVSHFNDCPSHPPASEQQDADRVMPGDGVVDLHGYCRQLADTGYRGYLSLELFREDLWAMDPLTVAKLGFEKMRPFVE